MNQKEFIDQLKANLKGIPETDIQDIVSDYEDHFRNALHVGKSEKEVCDALGDPKSLAKQYRVERKIETAAVNVSVSNIFKAVLASAGLGFFNLVFVLGPLLGLIGVLFGLFAAAIGIAIGGAAGLVASIVSIFIPEIISGMPVLLGIFGCTALTAFGVLFFIGDCYLGYFFYKGLVRYLKWNLEIIRK